MGKYLRIYMCVCVRIIMSFFTTVSWTQIIPWEFGPFGFLLSLILRRTQVDGFLKMPAPEFLEVGFGLLETRMFWPAFGSQTTCTYNIQRAWTTMINHSELSSNVSGRFEKVSSLSTVNTKWFWKCISPNFRCACRLGTQGMAWDCFLHNMSLWESHLYCFQPT